jgi:hypothetical protein
VANTQNLTCFFTNFLERKYPGPPGEDSKSRTAVIGLLGHDSQDRIALDSQNTTAKTGKNGQKNMTARIEQGNWGVRNKKENVGSTAAEDIMSGQDSQKMTVWTESLGQDTGQDDQDRTARTGQLR